LASRPLDRVGIEARVDQRLREEGEGFVAMIGEGAQVRRQRVLACIEVDARGVTRRRRDGEEGANHQKSRAQERLTCRMVAPEGQVMAGVRE
jgi:hypothetical protein